MCLLFIAFVLFSFTQELQDISCTLGDKETYQISALFDKRLETCVIKELY